MVSSKNESEISFWSSKGVDAANRDCSFGAADSALWNETQVMRTPANKARFASIIQFQIVESHLRGPSISIDCSVFTVQKQSTASVNLSSYCSKNPSPNSVYVFPLVAVRSSVSVLIVPCTDPATLNSKISCTHVYRPTFSFSVTKSTVSELVYRSTNPPCVTCSPRISSSSRVSDTSCETDSGYRACNSSTKADVELYPRLWAYWNGINVGT
mmetsp:Transcript_3265/g.7653  ORF Transcript_3265/g.7653 Transcript_3265/m.7653 type:complete len:213 (-) Transcript_3265:1105-1743(-)